MSNNNRPKLGSLGDQLAHLASYLKTEDRKLCRQLADHEVLTSTHIAQLVYGADGVARRRLAQLTRLHVTLRFSPHALGRHRAEYHYVLGEAGAAVLAAEQGQDPARVGYRREQALAIAYDHTRLTRLLTINGFFAQLTAAARDRSEATLVAWMSARQCAERWGTLVHPEAYGRWRDGADEVDFFVYTTIPEDLTRLLAAHSLLAAHTRRATPVLWWLPTPTEETRLRGQLGQSLVPVATASQPQGCPADAVWLPYPGDLRRPLAHLGRADVWQPTQPATTPPNPD